MSPEAEYILEQISKGYRLALPRNGDIPRLIPDRRFVNGLPERGYVPDDGQGVLVHRNSANEILASGLLREIPENNEQQRIGWRESGLPGDVYKLYACVQ